MTDNDHGLRALLRKLAGLFRRTGDPAAAEALMAAMPDQLAALVAAQLAGNPAALAGAAAPLLFGTRPGEGASRLARMRHRRFVRRQSKNAGALFLLNVILMATRGIAELDPRMIEAYLARLSPPDDAPETEVQAPVVARDVPSQPVRDPEELDEAGQMHDGTVPDTRACVEELLSEPLSAELAEVTALVHATRTGDTAATTRLTSDLLADPDQKSVWMLAQACQLLGAMCDESGVPTEMFANWARVASLRWRA